MSTVAVVNNATANTISSNIRISTFAIAAFDFLQTIPGEYRLYRRQYQNGRMSLLCFMFIVVRYVSVACLILNGVGFYSSHFDMVSCKKFYLSSVFTKFVAALASEGIIFRRTYAISKTRRTLVTLSVLAVLLLPLQVFGNTYKRGPVVGTGFEKGNCQTKTKLGDFVSAPYFYLANLIFDAVACAIATGSLLRRKSVHGDLGLFTRKVLKHGLLFAFGTTITNFLVFLALMNVPILKNLGAFLSISVTMILAQHLVLATAGKSDHSTSNSSGDKSSRDRSLSRDAKTRLPTMTVGSANFGFNRRSTMGISSKPANRGDTGVNQIELGGIRVHTETEAHTTSFGGEKETLDVVVHRPHHLSLDRDSKTVAAISPTTSMEDFVVYGSAEHGSEGRPPQKS